jgi:hypothetical protein
MYLLWISMSGKGNSKSKPSFLRYARQSAKGVPHRHRGLQESDTAAVDVGLYLAVQYLNAIDDVDVTRMAVSEITSLMTSTATEERRLTVITTSNSNRVTSASAPKEKYDGSM